MPGLVRLRQRNAPRITEKLFQVFQGILLDARANALPDNRVKIDENLSTQEPVDFLLACRVAERQALNGSRLVDAKVIDVEIGELLQPRKSEINEPFEGGALLRTVDCPS